MDDQADMWSKEERSLLQTLDQIVREKSVREAIDSVVSRLRQMLGSQPGVLMAYEQVPQRVFGSKLPPDIQSAWVFLLREPTVTGVAQHPNSHQRSLSYSGVGYFDLHETATFDDGAEGASHLLVSDFDAPLEIRWVSIPPGIWHQAVVTEGEWVIVSFHTAAEFVDLRPSEATA